MARRLKKQVYLVDDHPIVRDGLCQLITKEPDLAVCGQSDNAPQALAKILSLVPDITIVDLTLRDSSGIDLIGDLHSRIHDLPVLVLSMHTDTFYVEQALRAGVMGFLAKDEAAENIIPAIRRVLERELYLSQSMAVHLIGRMVMDRTRGNGSGSELEQLSLREREVFEMLGKGLSAREVAARLDLSVKTVETHRANIKEKLRLKTTGELVLRAVQHAIRN